MFIAFVAPQSIPRSGDFSTDIAGVGYIASDVICFNMSPYILTLAFFSTLITCKHCFVSASNCHLFFGPRHHGIDLFIQFMSLYTALCVYPH